MILGRQNVLDLPIGMKNGPPAGRFAFPDQRHGEYMGTARLQDAGDLLERPVGVRDVFHNVLGDHQVKTAIRKSQRFKRFAARIEAQVVGAERRAVSNCSAWPLSPVAETHRGQSARIRECAVSGNSARSA